MKFLYQFPNPTTIFAGRIIANGYMNAIKDMGHEFRFLTADDDPAEVFNTYAPDIFLTSLGPLHLKFLDLSILKEAKKKGTRVFASVPIWKNPMSKTRLNEVIGLSENQEYIKLISSEEFADFYYGYYEGDDPRMEGFERTTGKKYYTIPLAADKIALKPWSDPKFKADVSFIGTYLPEKREFFSKFVFPLKKKYKVKLYGQDWTPMARLLSTVQRAGQYFNIPGVRSLVKPPLKFDEEASVYLNSVISINVHENYQKKYGGDCNERTFKIPFSDGFEISDRVACISKYFKEGEEIVLADEHDWFDKIDYYYNNETARLKIMKAGKERVLKDHTYHNRINKIIELYKSL